MEPEFSVIIPSFNREATLERAIDSVINQTFRSNEIIVVDDGSTDNTVELVKNFQAVRYFHQENRGVTAARNRGAEEALGEWLIFLDSDDELDPQALFKFDLSISNNPDISVFVGGYTTIRNSIREISLPRIGQNSGKLSGTFVIRKEVFKNLGGFDTRLKFAENTELFFRMEQRGLSQGFVEYPVMIYNQDFSEGSRNHQNMLESLRLILEKHDKYLTDHVKFLYHQNIGVIELRFQNFKKARIHLGIAVKYRPKNILTYFRWGISFFPFLAKRIYPAKVVFK